MDRPKIDARQLPLAAPVELIAIRQADPVLADLVGQLYGGHPDQPDQLQQHRHELGEADRAVGSRCPASPKGDDAEQDEQREGGLGPVPTHLILAQNADEVLQLERYGHAEHVPSEDECLFDQSPPARALHS